MLIKNSYLVNILSMKVSSISNLLARSFLVFIITWLWASYYARGFFAILLISVTVMLGINFIISFVNKHRNKTKATGKQQREHMSQVILQLKFMTAPQALTLFKKALPQNTKEYVNQKRFTLCPLFHIAIPSEHDIIKAIKKAPKNSKVIVLAEFFPPALIAFVRSLDFNIVLLDAESAYTQILLPSETFPEIKIQTKKPTPKKTLGDLKAIAFNRSRTKTYIITGTVILFSSLIVRLHLYYIIIATIIFTLALTSYFSPTSSKNLFD